MRKTITKLLSCALSVLFAFGGFSACTKKGGGDGQLEILYFKGGTGSEWMDALCAEFEKDTGVKVKATPDNTITGSARTKLDAGRNLPDLMFIQLTNWREYVQKDWIAQMDELYDGSFGYTFKNGYTVTSSYDLTGTSVYSNGSNSGESTTSVTLRDIIIDKFKDYGYVSRKINEQKHFYVVPWHSPCVGIAYNVDILKEAGWNAPPATESELFKCVDDINALKDGSGNQKYSAFAWPGQEYGYWDFVTHTWWAQYEGVEEQRKFYDFESPEVFLQEGRAKALDLWQRLLVADNGAVKNSITGAEGLDHNAAQNEFAKGNAAFVVTGAFLKNEIRDITDETFHYKMMSVPMISGAKNENAVLNTEAGTFACIPKKAKNTELAKAFLAYMNQPKWIEKFTYYSGQMRPFNYKPTTIDGLHEYTKSVCALFESSDLLIRVSDSAIFNYADVKEWVKYSSASLYALLKGPNKHSASEVCNNMYNYAVTEWSNYEKKATGSEG